RRVMSKNYDEIHGSAGVISIQYHLGANKNEGTPSHSIHNARNAVEEEVMVNPAFPDQKGPKAYHTTLFEHKCEYHPSGTETKSSWFRKKQSSDEGSRGMD
ncbi:hypothetical protein Tco_0131954, partial [Tanacetum coccineum]